MEHELYNSIKQVDLALDASYKALILAGTGLCRIISPPATSTSSGISGYNIAFDSQYFYGCTGENLWGRAAISRPTDPLYCSNIFVYCNNIIIKCNATTYET